MGIETPEGERNAECGGALLGDGEHRQAYVRDNDRTGPASLGMEFREPQSDRAGSCCGVEHALPRCERDQIGDTALPQPVEAEAEQIAQ